MSFHTCSAACMRPCPMNMSNPTFASPSTSSTTTPRSGYEGKVAAGAPPSLAYAPRSWIGGGGWYGGGATEGRKGLKVRAVTRFVVMARDTAGWAAKIEAAAGLCASLVAEYTEQGYETQTLRIVTNPFGEYLDCSSPETALAGLEVLKQASVAASASAGLRIRVAIGAAQTAEEMALVPSMIKAFGDLCNICVNIEADENGVVDAVMCDLAAGAVVELGECTERGEGNFNFTANFHCEPLIPYFPAGYNTAETGECFAIGLEHPDLIHAVLEALRLWEVPLVHRSQAWADATLVLRDAVEAHVRILVAAAERLSERTGVRFAGLDSSAAPSKDCVSMCKLFEVRCMAGVSVRACVSVRVCVEDGVARIQM